MKSLKFFFVAIFFFIFSCSKRVIYQIEMPSSDYIKLPFSPSTDVIKKIESANSIWDLLSLVKKLEFNNLPEVDRIKNIKISLKDSVIIFSSKDSKFYIFNLSGKQIGAIENYGSGPKQYKILNEFYFYNSKIYLLVNANKKLQEYDLSGNLLNEYKIRNHLDLPDERIDFEHVAKIDNKLIAVANSYNENNTINKAYLLIYENFKDLIKIYNTDITKTTRVLHPSPIIFNDHLLFGYAFDNIVYMFDKNNLRLYNSIKLDFNNHSIIQRIFSQGDEKRIELLNFYTTNTGELKTCQNYFILKDILFVYASNDIFAVYEKEGKYYCRKNLLKFDPIKASAEDYNILELVHDKDFLEKHGIDQWAQFFPQDDCIAYVDYASSNDGGNKIIISIFGIK